MAVKKISIVDYGMGNLLSVAHAFEACGAEVNFIEANSDISSVDYLILPGVGAFPDGMKELTHRSLVHLTKKFAETGRPMMGICLGMQMLFDSSNEFGLTKGLQIISGVVEKISCESENKPLRLPFVGWSELKATGQDFLLADIPKNSNFYFVHSYEVQVDNPENLIAYTNYGDKKIAAIVKKDNVYGCQFHPEKSSKVGLKLLSNFLKI